VFDHVTFRYPATNRDVLRDISFAVRPKEKIAVLGATGSGKTALFQLIPRLYDTSSGGILIDGIPVSSFRLKTLRDQIGYVPQESLLFSGTISENLKWGKRDASLEEMVQAAKDAQIYETIETLPEQFETLIGQKGVNFSGGQKLQLSIARALIRRPKILLLDDSTSALDLKTEAKLLASLEKYDCTILMITQKVSTAMAADRILILNDGAVAAYGPHHELMETSPLYRKIVESQFVKEWTHDA